MTTHLHFTFGPVQSFVAQARRTQDLYAGSLLLSHLAVEAMKAIGGRKVVLPDSAALHEMQLSEHATAPNRFVAEFDSEEEAAEAGSAATKALLDAWRRIADAVWAKYLVAAVERGHDTAEIWRRQCDHFWEIAWVVGASEEHDLLDRRKNWRPLPKHLEGGDHCTLMGQWQELSGFIRSQRKSEQDAFWNAVRQETKELDLEPNERLCAIALIKRFFAAVSKEAIDRKLDAQSWPSTVTIAALPWMRKIAVPESDAHQKASAYAEEAGAVLGSWRRIRLLRQFPQSCGRFRELSGNFLNRTALANKDDTPIDDEARRPGLLQNLRSLERATGDRAGNFYALLLMDGDSMGALIREHGPAAVTTALTDFAKQIPSRIAENDGVCVYAGGDDLLALLPFDRALEAASAARALYLEAFGKQQTTATISAALVFAHYHCTLSRVLRYAHTLLDDVAKEGTGRDALAMGVLKPGGVTCRWSAPFDHFQRVAPHIFDPLIKAFDHGDEARDGKITASLLYNLRTRFSNLVRGHRSDAPVPADRETLHSLFTAEALIGKRDKDPARAAEQREVAESQMGQLLDVCELVSRNPATGGVNRTGLFDFDGARLLKFLALGGKEGIE